MNISVTFLWHTGPTKEGKFRFDMDVRWDVSEYGKNNFFVVPKKVFGFFEIPVCLNKIPCHISQDWFVQPFELQ